MTNGHWPSKSIETNGWMTPNHRKTIESYGLKAENQLMMMVDWPKNHCIEKQLKAWSGGNFNQHSKYKPAVVFGGGWWIVLSKGWRFSFGLCELIACFWHHIFFCAWPINMPSLTRAPLTRTEDIASQLEIREQERSARTFMFIQKIWRQFSKV